MGGSEEKVLSYDDVVLRRSDLDILSGPYFLNDRIIEFYFSYLSSQYSSQEILPVPPSITFWIMNCPVMESLNDFLEPLHLHDKKLILFPVNDNDDVCKAEGGSHWSLLAFHRIANVFVHHDSSNGMNKKYAKRLYNALVKFMCASNSESNPRYLECTESPQQVNGYDCGLYVTAIAKVICNWFDHGKDQERDGLWISAVKEQVTPSTVAEMRNEILELIKGLMVVKSGTQATK